MLALTIPILPTWHINVYMFNLKRKTIFKIQILKEAHFSSLLIAFCGLATPLWTIGVPATTVPSGTEVWLQSHPLSSAQASRMISKAGKWEDYATPRHPRQHTTPKSTAQDGLPGRDSDIAGAKPQAAINKEKGLLVAWLLAMWFMAPDRRTYMRWEREQSTQSWLRASPSGTKTLMTLLSPSNCCLSSISYHWGGKSSEL